MQAENTQFGEDINQSNRNYLRIKKQITGKRQVTNRPRMAVIPIYGKITNNLFWGNHMADLDVTV